MYPLLLLGCAGPVDPADLAPPPPVEPALTLSAGVLLPGAPVTFEAGGLQPGERVNFLRGAGVTARGPCPALAGGMCLQIGGPVAAITTATADAQGVARVTLTLPAALPEGLDVGLQAVALRGRGGSSSVRSPAVRRITGARDASALAPGDVVISEILYDPEAGRGGEWIELTSLVGFGVDLGGLTLADSTGAPFTLPTGAVLPAGGQLVLGASTDPARNGGAPVDLAWGEALWLGDEADAVTLVASGGAELDRVAWDGGGVFPDPRGDSLSLDPGALDVTANDGGASWCAAAPTPGAPNPACPSRACGDGWLDPGEACDDGGLVVGDGCDAACAWESCPVPEERAGLTKVHNDVGSNQAHVTPDGDVVVHARSTGLANDVVDVIRLDGDALTPRWSTRLESSSLDPNPYLALGTPDGGAWVLFSVSDSATHSNVLNLVRLDDSGAIVAASRYDGGTYDAIDRFSADLLADGGLIVVATRTSRANDDRVVTGLRVDAAGEVTRAWELHSDTDHEDETGGVRALRDGGALVWAVRFDRLQPTTLEVDGAWVARLDADGQVLWARWTESTNGFSSDGLVLDARETWAGDLFLATTRTTSNFYAGATLLSADGDVRWSSPERLLTLNSEPLLAAQLPATCAAPPVEGDVCADVGVTCASPAGQICSCDGAWTCRADSPELILASGRLLRFTEDGAIQGAHSLTDGFGLSAAAATPGGGLRAVLRPHNWTFGEIAGVLETSRNLDAPCTVVDAAVPGVGGSAPLLWVPISLTRSERTYTRADEGGMRATARSTQLHVVCAGVVCPADP